MTTNSTPASITTDGSARYTAFSVIFNGHTIDRPPSVRYNLSTKSGIKIKRIEQRRRRPLNALLVKNALQSALSTVAISGEAFQTALSGCLLGMVYSAKQGAGFKS